MAGAAAASAMMTARPVTGAPAHAAIVELIASTACGIRTMLSPAATSGTDKLSSTYWLIGRDSTTVAASAMVPRHESITEGG